MGLSQSLNGFQVGIGVPILFSGNVSKSKVAQPGIAKLGAAKANEEQKREQFVNQKKNELAKYQKLSITIINTEKVIDEIIKVGNTSYKHGEIDFFQYIQSLENATDIQAVFRQCVQFNKTQLDSQYLNF
jgi:cobalt-zinc-cadmium resistance protein CzcA